MSKTWYDGVFKATNVEFEQWWLGFYGTPDQYAQEQDEQDEYWTRKGFARHGWERTGKVALDLVTTKVVAGLPPGVLRGARTIAHLIDKGVLAKLLTPLERPAVQFRLDLHEESAGPEPDAPKPTYSRAPGESRRQFKERLGRERTRERVRSKPPRRV